MTRDLSEAVLPIVKATRDIVLPMYGRAEELARKDGSAGSAVTALDIAVEDHLRSQLKRIDPRIGFVGEERGGNRNAERFWLCDPIDGTMFFIRGMPFCTVMLALIEEGRVVFGTIYDFVNDVAYHAQKGRGAYKDRVSICVSNRPARDALVAFESRMHRADFRDQYHRVNSIANMLHTCAGAEYAAIASGKLEARINSEPWGNDYDYAAGSILVQEAGGVVANIGKTTYDYRDLSFIAATPAMFDVLTKGKDALFPIV